MHNPFELTRWFAILGLLTTALVSAGSSFVLSRFMADNLLQQDAAVSMEFVQRFVEMQGAEGYFTGEREPDHALASVFTPIASMPDVLRINAFSRERKIIWSSDPNMIGRTFHDNDDLEAALRGRLQFLLEEQESKAEHIFLDSEQSGFVENYLPLRQGSEVIGVIEVYKRPRALFASMADSTRLIWLSGMGGSVFLYALLVWVVRRAERIIRVQQAQVLESETLAALGAMASAVAHGIRNPLASIRSSAELNLRNASAEIRDASEDIVDEVDRLERWVRDLLAYAVPETGDVENVQIAEVLHDSINSFSGLLAKRGIAVTSSLAPNVPPVRGDAALLTQVFNSLLTNAMEAMPQGGQVEVALGMDTPPTPDRLRISISDTGAGWAPEYLANAFMPRKSTKRTGLGVGLPLAKRIVERFGGAIELVGRPKGATVTIDLVIAR